MHFRRFRDGSDWSENVVRIEVLNSCDSFPRIIRGRLNFRILRTAHSAYRNVLALGNIFVAWVMGTLMNLKFETDVHGLADGIPTHRSASRL